MTRFLENSIIMYEFERDVIKSAIQTIIGTTIFLGLFSYGLIYFKANQGNLFYAILGIGILVWLLILTASFRDILKGGKSSVCVDQQSVRIEQAGGKVFEFLVDDISEVILKKRVSNSGDSSRCYLILKDGREVWLAELLTSIGNQKYHGQKITEALESLNCNLALKRVKVDNF